MIRGKLLLLALLVPALSCNEIYTDGSSPTQPSNNGRTTAYQIEYRVFGTATSITARYSNSEDGLNQVQTSLPFLITVGSNKDTIFLSLEAVAQSFGSAAPFMNAQILVNGQLFREASTTNFFTPLIVSGTYRR